MAAVVPVPLLLLALPAGVAGAAAAPLTVRAAVETPPLFDDGAGGDADADDPAIWVHPRHHGRSLVLVTAKDAGLYGYDLAGRQVQVVRPPVSADPGDAPGRFNNVDILTGVLLGGRRVDLAVVTDRGHDTLRFFAIDAVSGRLADVTAAGVPLWSPCAEPGEDPQVEGMVVDTTTGVLYAAQEDVALWRVPTLGPRFAGRPRMIEPVREYGVPAVFDPQKDECVVDHAGDPGFGGRIAADVEGLTIYPTGPWSGVLVVSSQGDSTFHTHDRRTNRHLRQFSVTDGAVDAVQHCDGAHVVRTPLPGFPRGLLVVHDGGNAPDVFDEDGAVRPNTNVKYVDAGFLSRVG